MTELHSHHFTVAFVQLSEFTTEGYTQKELENNMCMFVLKWRETAFDVCLVLLL
jgi:hypothetical protein